VAKRKAEDPPAGLAPWMATFSDLMNLLLCFFVLLFSMSTIEESKWAELVASMNNTFSVFSGGSTAIGDGILISAGVSQLNELDEYINSTGKLAEMVEEAVSEDKLSDQIDVSFTSQYVQLTMKGALLFDSGSAELKQESYDVLDKVSVILERYAEGTIEIEGHTDNVPIKSTKFADNEELSSARALSVFYYLTEHSLLDDTRLKHAGMGERIPIADNSTAEGRSKNRRVEIRIYNPS
jgi:chemotaxis protein MotB